MPRFRFWVRRSPGEGAVYAIRFEVEGGKGLLRVARPGVLVDPPARESGFEERLTSAQVRASRFLHVWDSGRKRQGYVLSRLTDPVLGGLPPATWEELHVVSDGGFCWLVPGGPEELDSSAIVPIEVAAPAPSVADLPSIDVSAADELEEIEEDPVSEEPPAVVPVVAEQVSAPVVEPDPAEVLSESSLMVFGRATNLVRYLRREKARDRHQLAELQAELDRVRRLLDESQRRETELLTRVAQYQRRLKARESALQK
ncbi:DUF4763 domain-containing protein [Myxococcota bacterium]|nr:DUF4763 domain-containing protein [Myxococcota bacterium]